jgi:adenine-specific DNA-methyltransferase
MNVSENMTDDYKNQLKRLLRNLFQFDSADLDFGIYRIMNKKRDEIERFIEEDLIDAVEAGFGEYSESKGANLKDEIEAIKAEIHENLGEDALDDSGEINQIYVTTPFAKKLADRYEKARAAMKDSDMSAQQEAEIFSHIYQFFSRYYDNGDFMSLRRYSQKEKYAIPYNGEEVVLHWANKDQYYIKTGENFKNYSFKIGEYTIEFLIREAEGTTNNNKAEKRFFVLAGDNMDYDDSSKTLTIFFEYRGLSKDEEKKYGTRNVQEVIITGMKDDIPLQVQDSGLKGALNKIVDKSKDTEKTFLEKHLRAYTKKNTTDYFIHKDLKGFLTLELDFYIKNEVFHLDDLGTENEVGVEQYVSRVRVMKSICLKVIDFLAQIEDFQKMLFEKKKFVVRTDYCMTLDHVPEELYAEILGNEAQLDEWRVLYGIGKEKQQTITSFESESIDDEYLKEHPYLVLDTKFFDREFKDRLLASFDDLDEATGGLMIKSENWQALNIMQDKYREKVKCIYIDPPYNTGNDEFIYKDNYQHSSWLTMIRDRLSLSSYFLEFTGSIFVSIGEGEQYYLKQVMSEVFGVDNLIASIIWQKSKKGDAKLIAQIHDYILAYAKNKNQTIQKGYWRLPKEGVSEVLEYYTKVKTKFGNDHELIASTMKEWYSGLPNDDPRKSHRHYNNSDTIGLYFASDFAGPDDGRLSRPRYDIIHPIIGKPCKKPSTGWRWDEERTRKALTMNPPLIHFGADETTIPCRKTYLKNVTGEPFISVFYKDGRTGTIEVEQILGFHAIDFPKNVEVIQRLFQVIEEPLSIYMDFFAGSATSAHAILNLNKEDRNNRKYILVEMGDYFDTIMKPRIQKVMYSSTWKNGKPQSTDGISHIFKYQTLEQYEDTLNNIEFTEGGTVQRTLADMDGYFLRYMLDFETRDNPCRFNVEKLTKPFNYTLKINQGNELKEEAVDMVETFNYLLGLHVRKIRTFTNNGTYYRVVLGTKDEDDIVVIWRDTEDLDLKADKEFIEGTILNEFNPTKAYVNADFYVEGAHPIEPVFKKLMVG